MSIVRVSALKGAVHGVHLDGAFVHGPYQRRRLLGRTEELAEPPTPPAGPPRPDETPPGFPGPRSALFHLLERRVRPAIEELRDGPVVVLVHGFLFDPRDAVSSIPADSDNPHARIYHFLPEVERESRDHTTGWPVHLGFAEEDGGASGLAFAFGWHSRPGFARSLITRFQNFYARAYENAEGAAWNLACCLHVLARLLPEEKPIDFFCHSLGSRVVIRCLALLAKHRRTDLLARVGRVLILGGAEYVVEARHMLSRLAAVGMRDRIAFYNIVSRENDVLDKLGENFGPRTFGMSNVIGHNGLDVENPAVLGPGWLDLQIDGHALQRWLAEHHGLRVTGDNPESVWDHWYYYTDHGNMALYRRILREREAWDVTRLRAAGIPDRVARGRSLLGD